MCQTNECRNMNYAFYVDTCMGVLNVEGKGRLVDM